MFSSGSVRLPTTMRFSFLLLFGLPFSLPGCAWGASRFSVSRCWHSSPPILPTIRSVQWPRTSLPVSLRGESKQTASAGDAEAWRSASRLHWQPLRPTSRAGTRLGLQDRHTQSPRFLANSRTRLELPSHSSRLAECGALVEEGVRGWTSSAGKSGPRAWRDQRQLSVLLHVEPHGLTAAR